MLDAIAASGGRAQFVQLDLGDLDSVRKCAQTITEAADRFGPLELLINNAGLAGARGMTKSGFEIGFGTNHVGTFALTMQLIGLLRSGASERTPARIVTVSSKSHYKAKDIDFEAVQKTTDTRIGLHEYEVSKLANVLFSAELARRLGSGAVHTYAVHPGVVASDIWRRLPALLRPLALAFMKTNAEGAQTTLHCALSPAAASETGLYYHDSAPRTPSRLARDEALARTLWERSAAWTGVDLSA